MSDFLTEEKLANQRSIDLKQFFHLAQNMRAKLLTSIDVAWRG